MKPVACGNVWTAVAKIQIIEGSQWKTLATCIDTPNAIKAEAAKLTAQGYRDLWVEGQATGRKMVGDL